MHSRAKLKIIQIIFWKEEFPKDFGIIHVIIRKTTMQRCSASLNEKETFEPNKKRKVNEDIGSVFVSAEKLLVMSSAELEQRVEQLSCLRPLTPTELKEVKRQMRLVKNREYAQSSRIKKKQHVEKLQEENAVLQERVQQLEDENRELKMLLNPSGPSFNLPTNPFPTSFGNQDFSVSSFLFESDISSSDEMSQFFSSDSPLSSPLSTESFTPEYKHSLSASGGFATTTFCMFLIMLSFGIFFSSVPGVLSTFPMAKINQQVIPFSVSSDQTLFYRTSRSLLSHEDIDSIRPNTVQSHAPNITDTSSSQNHVRKEISYYEVLLDEANQTQVL
jgi:hypothetical protein